MSSSYQATPFDNIYTQIRVPDLEGYESLFQAELNRCRDLISMTKEGTFLAVFDELFTSTTSEEGVSCAYAMCKVLGGLPNGMVFMTTHYPKLTCLSQETGLSYWNGSLGVSFSKGLPVFDYRLREGPSFHRIALDLLEIHGRVNDQYTNTMFQQIIYEARQTLSEVV
jgi:DNA mismatch repair ATPase MutS